MGAAELMDGMGAAELMDGKGAIEGCAMAEPAKARARTTANICNRDSSKFSSCRRMPESLHRRYGDTNGQQWSNTNQLNAIEVVQVVKLHVKDVIRS